MRPKEMSEQGTQDELFRSRLEQILNRKHPLFLLANQMDWSFFEQEFGPLYVEKVGRPGLPIRLIVGLHYLKYTFNESDESVVERFLENPYWQYFCGTEYFRHEIPLDPSSLVRWRKRVGAKGMEKLLKESIETAKRKRFIRARHLERVNVDTTVQEKAVAFPRTTVHLTNKKKRTLKRSEWKWLRRRSAIEPVFGHLKADNRLERNPLYGKEGDRINAILAGCGFNLRKLLRAFLLPIFKALFGSPKTEQSKQTILITNQSFV